MLKSFLKRNLSVTKEVSADLPWRVTTELNLRNRVKFPVTTQRGYTLCHPLDRQHNHLPHSLLTFEGGGNWEAGDKPQVDLHGSRSQSLNCLQMGGENFNIQQIFVWHTDVNNTGMVLCSREVYSPAVKATLCKKLP